MAITNAFREAVDKSNLIGIRIMLKDSLLVDPSFNEFAEMEFIALQASNIYDTHDGCELLSSESAWDDNYMNELMVEVVENFSRERIEHLKQVVRKLRPVPVINPSAISSPHKPNENSKQQSQYSQQPDYQARKTQDKLNGSYRRGAKIAGGVVVGAVVGAVIATPVIGAAVGAVVGGAVVAIVTNEEH